MSQIKKIGDRIREFRKREGLSQEEFARQLGVKGGYISTLETHRNEPSEQLILNICRTFGVFYDWLKYGKLDAPPAKPRGQMISEEVLKEIGSPKRKLDLFILAQILGIDPIFPLSRREYPEGFYQILNYLTQIFRKGSPGEDKIEAIISQLRAFLPKENMPKIKRDLKK